MHQQLQGLYCLVVAEAEVGLGHVQHVLELLVGGQLALVVAGVVADPVGGDGGLQHLLWQPEQIDEGNDVIGSFGSRSSPQEGSSSNTSYFSLIYIESQEYINIAGNSFAIRPYQSTN